MLQRRRTASGAADGHKLDQCVGTGFSRCRRAEARLYTLLDILDAQIADLQNLRHQIRLNLLEPWRHISARLGNEVDRPELEGLENAAIG